MNFELNLFSTIGLLGVIQGLILSIVLFLSDFKRSPQNRILLSLISSFTLISFGSLAYYSGLIYIIPYFIRVHSPMAFLLAPLMYLYFKMMLNYDYKIQRKDYFHFLPFLFVLILFMPVYLMPVSEKLIYLSNQFNRESFSTRLFYYSIPVSGIVYLFLTFKAMLKSYKDEKRLKTKRAEGIKKWLIIFSIFCLLIFIASLIRLIVGVTISNTYWLPLIIAVFVYYHSYSALKNPFIFDSRIEEKYLNSQVDIAALETILSKATNYVSEHKLYLDDHVSISQLAQKISVQVNSLSRAINELKNQNYFDFMNSFRVELAKERLVDAKFNHLSLEGLAEDCGFKSKSTFYSIFKKHEKCTPKQYRDKLLVRDSKLGA